MKRLVLVALFLAGWLPAQETPMVITQPNGNYVAVINPSVGIVSSFWKPQCGHVMTDCNCTFRDLRVAWRMPLGAR